MEFRDVIRSEVELRALMGLIFLIPGKRETLRIGGTAEVVRDSALRESLAPLAA